MARTVAIGIQDFETLITRDYFYVDKTKFIREWWDKGDSVTLIARPRRFGKTLTMNMLERFFSVRYEGKGEVFEGLAIWREENYRKLQGTCPVISLTFANVKERDAKQAKWKINAILEELYQQNGFLLDSEMFSERDRQWFERVYKDMDDVDASLALHRLSRFLSRYHGKKVIILLDEYDAPMLEAYLGGYWEEMVS